MPAWVKVALAVIGLLILLVAACNVVVYKWAMKHKEDFAAVRQEGVEFGKGKTAAQCIDASIRRASGITEMSARIGVTQFTDGCLDSASDVKAFCARVPEGIMAGGKWAAEECRRRGDKDQAACVGAVNAAVQRCMRDRMVAR